MLLHRNIVANLQQHHAHLNAVLREGRDIVITAIPLFHIYALTVSCLLAIKVGAANVLIANPRDIPGLVKELRKHRFTCLPASTPCSRRCWTILNSRGWIFRV